jgi:hypothetical protein
VGVFACSCGLLEELGPERERDTPLSDASLAALEVAVSEQVAEAVGFAEAGPWEPVAALLRDVSTPTTEDNNP